MTGHDHMSGAAASVNPFVVPILTTSRLTIRPLDRSDLQSCLDLFTGIGWTDSTLTSNEVHAGRESWLTWTIYGYRELARLYQPPLGERAIVTKEGGRFVGLVGYVPSFEPFRRLRGLGADEAVGRTMELGLFWALDRAAQGQGYATEAAAALIDHAFLAMAAEQVVATTTHDNAASIAVMRRLGMRIEAYDLPHPGLQVVGVRKARE